MAAEAAEEFQPRRVTLDTAALDEARARIDELMDHGQISPEAYTTMMDALDKQSIPDFGQLYRGYARTSTEVRGHWRRDGAFVRKHLRNQLRVLASDFLEGNLSMDEFLDARRRLVGTSGAEWEPRRNRRFRIEE